MVKVLDYRAEKGPGSSSCNLRGDLEPAVLPYSTRLAGKECEDKTSRDPFLSHLELLKERWDRDLRNK